jgi:hypothetical protein
MKWSRWRGVRIEQKLDAIFAAVANIAAIVSKTQQNQEHTIMPTIADIAAADAQMKGELDTITTGVTNLVAANAKLATDLAAAIAANDPAALQAVLDAANANVAEGQAIVGKLPTPTP